MISTLDAQRLVFADEMATKAAIEEPTSGLEPPTCSLRVSRHMFVAVHRGSKIRIGKVNQPYDP
jgi:hypothetical protein